MAVKLLNVQGTPLVLSIFEDLLEKRGAGLYLNGDFIVGAHKISPLDVAVVWSVAVGLSRSRDTIVPG
jgi:hypothetical protein